MTAQTPPSLEPAPSFAWVVFADQVGLAWLKLVRRNFRHCFLLVACDVGWILFNPLSHCTELCWLADAKARALLRAHPAAVLVRVRAAPPRFSLPWRPFTCVEAVKRALGLGDAARVVTPWQLYRHLVRHHLVLDFHPKIG